MGLRVSDDLPFSVEERPLSAGASFEVAADFAASGCLDRLWAQGEDGRLHQDQAWALHLVDLQARAYCRAAFLMQQSRASEEKARRSGGLKLTC